MCLENKPMLLMDCRGVWPFRLHLSKWRTGKYIPEAFLPPHVVTVNFYVNF